MGGTTPAWCFVLSLCSTSKKLYSQTVLQSNNIVRDIKSMQAEGRSGEENTMLVTQEDVANLSRNHPAEKSLINSFHLIFT